MEARFHHRLKNVQSLHFFLVSKSKLRDIKAELLDIHSGKKRSELQDVNFISCYISQFFSELLEKNCEIKNNIRPRRFGTMITAKTIFSDWKCIFLLLEVHLVIHFGIWMHKIKLFPIRGSAVYNMYLFSICLKHICEWNIQLCTNHKQSQWKERIYCY